MNPGSQLWSPATRAWWSYERPATCEVIGTMVDVPVRDGITISCELRRPARGGMPVEGRFPSVVVEFTPYAVLHDFFLGEADYFVARGYNALVPILRGIGGSGGAWEHGGFRQAGRDAHDIIEWLATQEFSDGRVGMYGESYGGQTSYGAAMERPEHLVAIAPTQAPSSLFHDVIFPGGIKATERGDVDNWPDIANLTSGGVIDAEAEFAANRAHTTFDEFWRERSFVDCLDAVSIPVLAIGGWNDMYFRSGTLANIEALPERTWAIYGPWNHFFPVSFGDDDQWADNEERAQALTDAPPLPGGVVLAWFDHWVAGLPDVPIPPAPTFTSFEGPIGVGTGWLDLERWDRHGAGVELRLGSDGPLGPDAPGDEPLTLRQPADAEVEALTFTTAPVVDDQVLVGAARLTFRAALDASEAHFYVELLDVDPDGAEVRVNDGFLAASHRDSHTDPAPVIAGETNEYTVEVRAQHHRFVAGNRVRLRISGGAPSLLTAPPAPVTVTMETNGTAVLHLPGFTGLS